MSWKTNFNRIQKALANYHHYEYYYHDDLSKISKKDWDDESLDKRIRKDDIQENLISHYLLVTQVNQRDD